MSMDRVELKLVDGEWRLDCGCRLHYWDHLPMKLAVPGGLLPAPGNLLPRQLKPDEQILCGKVAPHLHLCEQHRKQS